MKKFNMIRDINGYNGFGMPFSDNKYGGVLAANTEQTVTVPNSPFADFPNLIAVFGFQRSAKIWVSINTTATVPSSTVGAVDVELNPFPFRYVKGGDVLHFISSDTTTEFGVTFYSIY